MPLRPRHRDECLEPTIPSGAHLLRTFFAGDIAATRRTSRYGCKPARDRCEAVAVGETTGDGPRFIAELANSRCGRGGVLDELAIVAIVGVLERDPDREAVTTERDARRL